MITPKVIDITNQEVIRKLNRDGLIADALARKDKEALRWLEDEFFMEVPAKDKEGNPTGKMKPKPLIVIRSQYLQKFCGYVPIEDYSAEARAKAKAERETQLREKFAEAFRML